MQPDPEILGDARSMLEAMRRMVRYASDATEKPDARIDAEDLNGAKLRLWSCGKP